MIDIVQSQCRDAVALRPLHQCGPAYLQCQWRKTAIAGHPDHGGREIADRRPCLAIRLAALQRGDIAGNPEQPMRMAKVTLCRRDDISDRTRVFLIRSMLGEAPRSKRLRLFQTHSD